MNYLLSIILLLFSFFSPLILAQTCSDTITSTTPDSRFSVLAGEVKDNYTGLIWQQCSLGQSGSDCSVGNIQSYTWQSALEAAQQVQHNTGKAWRLPNIKELRSIIERQCVSSAINATIFPNTLSSHCWSASPGANYSGNAWYVVFLWQFGQLP